MAAISARTRVRGAGTSGASTGAVSASIVSRSGERAAGASTRAITAAIRSAQGRASIAGSRIASTKRAS